MNTWYKVNLLVMLMIATLHAFAQKETYDVISYTLPAGWQKAVKENGLQLNTPDKKNGEYAVVVILKSTPSGASAIENFNNYWTKLVKGTVSVTEAPTMVDPSRDKGWDITSGWALYTDGTNKGVVTLITASGGGKVAVLVTMTNTAIYQQDLEDFLNNIQLTETVNGPPTPSFPATSTLTGKIWEGTTTEKFTVGAMNGYNTGGYFTAQYRFNADGTYQFVNVLASAHVQTNSLQYETGTYTVNGRQLTIIPTNGANEEWSLAAGPVKLAGMSDVQIRDIKSQWGKRLKTTKRKLEKVTYTYSVAYQEGNHSNALILEGYNGHTEREGNSNKTYYFETNEAKSVKLPMR